MAGTTHGRTAKGVFQLLITPQSRKSHSLLTDHGLQQGHHTVGINQGAIDIKRKNFFHYPLLFETLYCEPLAFVTNNDNFF
jgi:hypothetical protein